MYKNELEIDVGRCLKALVKKKKFIAIIALLFFIIGFALTINVGEDMYTATATVYAASDDSVENTMVVTTMNAYLNVAKSYKVSQRAALIIGRSEVSAEDVQKAMNVSSSSTTTSASTISNFMNSSATIISFNATTSDAALSMEMADAMAESYAMEMSEILNSDSVKMLDNAYTYSKSKNATKDAWKKRIMAALLGVVLACAFVVLCEIFDRKVRTVREATIKEDLPIIGLIPDYKE